MVRCAFNHCKSSTDEFKLFCVPKVNPRSINIIHNHLRIEQRSAWLKALNLKDDPEIQEKDLRVCSLHFHHGKPANLHERENIDWAPSINVNNDIEENDSDDEVAPGVPSVSQFEESVNISQNSTISTEENTQNNNEAASNVSSIPPGIQKSNGTLKYILPESLTDDGLVLTRSFGTQTDHWEEESDFDSEISSESSILTEKEGIFYHCSAIQVGDPWNKVKQLHEEIKTLKNEVDRLRRLLTSTTKLNMQKEVRNVHLNDQLSNANNLNRILLLDEAAFTNDEKDKKITFFTALPNLKMFNLILKTLEKSLDEISSARLNNFQKLILTFMKLRFNASFTALSYRFLITLHEARRIFYSVVILISHSFQDFIHWPSADCMKLNVPKCFQDVYGDRVSVIIDCFEISTQRPNTLKGRNEMFSQYKQNYTVKYLIGITTQGVISFISNGYTGRTSDNAVTESSGILDKLLPGDIVLADRGFTVSELISQRKAQLKTPAFKKNPQFHPIEIEETRRLASARVHVERLIGQARIKYKILNGPIPISLLKIKYQNKSVLNEIVRAACILVNLCDGVIPID